MGSCNTKSQQYEPSQLNTKQIAVGSPWHKGSILGTSKSWSQDIPLAACSDDKRISLFSDALREGSLNSDNIVYCSGHSRAVNKVEAGNRFIWSVSRDLSLRQWSFDGKAVQTLENIHNLNISSVALSAEEKIVFTGSRDYSVKGYDVETKTPTHQFSAPRNVVTFLECSQSAPDLIVQGSEDLCVRVWDVRSKRSTIPSLHLTQYVYFPLSGSMDGSGMYLATGSKGFNGVGCEVKVWDLRTSKVVSEFSGIHCHDVTACRFVTDRVIATASKDGKLCLWDIKMNTLASSVVTDKIYTSISVKSDADPPSDRVIAVGAFDGGISFHRIDGIENDDQTDYSLTLLAQTASYFQESTSTAFDQGNESSDPPETV